ncbi:HAD family phosphatase [Dissulfurirhabdus thermomarina]|uniref:HAD family phosphatase n=1 Tax=Dissulfurirhabdus thermomarina TaxID=1765737 RepID=A0A6N9TJP2_DISTH|nr:HAD family phosphatase [Dissulfurirhabdus thermomarina]NDY41299.1 HAD family phosphatase [Dissulfurirhabdus thermomarina]NMX23756.1 HAD family phosphatase [Dissulfurirhabdus thermomarina]
MQPTILFDMDGVILDSMPWHVRAWQAALAEFGFSVPEAVLYLHEGAIEPETAVAIFDGEGCRMDPADFHRVLERQKAVFAREYRHRVRPYPEVPGLLDRLEAEGWRMGLVTSSHAEILDQVLPGEIRRRMRCIVTGERVARRKPFPDPYLAAMEALGIGPGGCCVVENAPAGIRAAKAAGLACAAITTTLAAEHLVEADVVVTSHRALPDRLAGLLALPGEAAGCGVPAGAAGGKAAAG